MVLGQLTQLLNVIVGGLDKGFQCVPQVAEVAGDQIELGGAFGGEPGGGETAGEQHAAAARRRPRPGHTSGSEAVALGRAQGALSARAPVVSAPGTKT